jgi:hypothetical protein
MTTTTAKAWGWLLPLGCIVQGGAALDVVLVIAWRVAQWLAAWAFLRVL